MNFFDRRSFLRGLLATGAATAARGADPSKGATQPRAGKHNAAISQALDPSLTGSDRAAAALKIRQDAAVKQSLTPLPLHIDNGDESLLPNYIGSFSKGLTHSQLGEVDASAYSALLDAIASGKQSGFEKLPRGSGRKLANPQAAFCYSLIGTDSHALYLEPPPSLSSAGMAAEMVELYWHSLTRDVPFNDYATSPLIAQAAQELGQLSDYRGPRDISNLVMPQTIFRGLTSGDLIGPYISQFLWKPLPFNSTMIDQKYRVGVAGSDYLTSYSEWTLVQSGLPPFRDSLFEAEPRYITTGRGLAEWVHYDYIHQAHQNAAVIILDNRPESILSKNLYQLSPTNPYKNSAFEAGFVTFNAVHIGSLLGLACQEALKAAWYQKWAVHRRLRPEAMGGRLHNLMTHQAAYPIHPELTNSQAVQNVFHQTGTYLLPQAFVEGSPLHPSYPSGHATVAGACSTLLKAFFDENALVPNAVVPTSDGLTLHPYDGDLTIGNELNKLASNLAIGRNWGGIHYRSDAEGGMLLGEQVAIGILQDAVNCTTEDFTGFQFTSFLGDRITITPAS